MRTDDPTTFFHEDAVDRRRRRVLRIGALVAVLSLPYLSAIPASVLRGVAVTEPCAERIRSELGHDAWVGAESRAEFSWFLPGWRCESPGNARHESVSVLLPPFGGRGWSS